VTVTLDDDDSDYWHANLIMAMDGLIVMTMIMLESESVRRRNLPVTAAAGRPGVPARPASESEWRDGGRTSKQVGDGLEGKGCGTGRRD
jgi:hypothetical protein